MILDTAIPHFSSAFSNQSDKYTTLIEFVNDIKNGTFKKEIETLRKITDKSERQDYKKKNLQAVSLSCDFSGTRAKSNAISHTGIMQVDFDGKDDIDLNSLRMDLINDPYVAFVFTGPSGDGIKAGVRISRDIETHTDCFLQFKERFKNPYWDDAVKDISRLCYYSYDPDVYVNQGALEFKAIKKMPKKKAVAPIPFIHDEANRRWANDALQSATKTIADAPEGELHLSRLRAGEYLGGVVAHGILTESEAVSAMEHCISNYTRLPIDKAMKSFNDALKHGMGSPIDPPEYVKRAQKKKAAEKQIIQSTIGGEAETVQELTADQVEKVKTSFYKILGYKDNQFYYMNNKRGEIKCISEFTKPVLLAMTNDLQYWESMYSGEKGGVNWDQAIADCLCEGSERIFNPNVVRGRGFWLDRDRVVFNMGDKLMVDGKKHKHGDIQTDYIYQKGERLKVSMNDELSSVDQSKKLVKIFDRLPLYSDLDKICLAGWSFVAIVAGALKWRPALWIVAPAGSGKSWTRENIIDPILGNLELQATSEQTTEAGLRQHIGSDALVVVHDEAEAKTDKGRKNLEAKLFLARTSSGESNAKVLHGSKNGQGVSYTVRSQFMFISTVHPDLDKADSDRITIIEMVSKRKRVNSDLQFKELSDMVFETITDEYCDGIRTRAVNMIPVIKDSIEIFGTEIAKITKDRRKADQYSPMFAGHWCLEHDYPPTAEEADILLNNFDLSSDDITEETEDEKCLNTILSLIPRDWEQKQTVAEKLMGIISGSTDFEHRDRQELGWIGLSLDRYKDHLFIEPRNVNMKALLQNTNYADTYKTELSRIEGAVVGVPHNMTGKTKRCLKLPVSALGLHVEKVEEPSESEMF